MFLVKVFTISENACFISFIEKYKDCRKTERKWRIMTLIITTPFNFKYDDNRGFFGGRVVHPKWIPVATQHLFDTHLYILAVIG